MRSEVLMLLGAYLLGSVPLVYALGKRRGVDLRTWKDKKVGGSALIEAGGKREGVIGAIGDAFKGIITAFVARSFFDFNSWVVPAAGIAVIVGQCWPIFLRFKGGRGNTTTLGLAITLVPKETILALISPLIGLLASGFPNLFTPNLNLKQRFKFSLPRQSKGIPLGMLGTFTLLPLLCWFLGKPPSITLGFSAILLIILIRRLTAELREDWRRSTSKAKLLLNRFLYDRSS